jgi:hypothetical protein
MKNFFGDIEKPGIPPKPKRFDRDGAKTYCRHHDCFDCPFEHKGERGLPINRYGYSNDRYLSLRRAYPDGRKE